MDGISTNATLIPEQSINATVAILENTQELLGTAYFGGQGVSEIVGDICFRPSRHDSCRQLGKNIETHPEIETTRGTGSRRKGDRKLVHRRRL